MSPQLSSLAVLLLSLVEIESSLLLSSLVFLLLSLVAGQKVERDR